MIAFKSSVMRLYPDVNAAKNILKEGKRLVAAGYVETQNARGGDVRLGTNKRIPMKRDKLMEIIF